MPLLRRLSNAEAGEARRPEREFEQLCPCWIPWRTAWKAGLVVDWELVENGPRSWEAVGLVEFCLRSAPVAQGIEQDGPNVKVGGSIPSGGTIWKHMHDFLLTKAELRVRDGGKWHKFPADVLPAYVADMDFKVAPSVQAAIERLTANQDYVYESPAAIESLYAAFASWMERRYGWRPDANLTIGLADVVQGTVATLVAFTSPGDGVIVQTPVYPPFLHSIEWTGRRRIENPLRNEDDRYEVDFGGLDDGAAGARLLLLCNPHNPTGRVLERSELERIVDIAERHDLTIVSDEIHADLVYPGAKHIPTETIPGAAERTVTLTSATKSFNIPGTRAAVLHFGSEKLKALFNAAIPDHLLGRPGRFGVEATTAAWMGGEAWLGDVLAYLESNRRVVSDWVESQPRVNSHTPEATYLAWLDFRELELEMSPCEFLLDRAKVGLSDGAEFGGPGIGHVRLNFGTSAEILREILDRMSSSLA